MKLSLHTILGVDKEGLRAANGEHQRRVDGTVSCVTTHRKPTKNGLMKVDALLKKQCLTLQCCHDNLLLVDRSQFDTVVQGLYDTTRTV
jgi:hypothetical protein